MMSLCLEYVEQWNEIELMFDLEILLNNNIIDMDIYVKQTKTSNRINRKKEFVRTEIEVDTAE